MTLLPFPPYAPDVSDFQGATTQTARNVVARGDGYGPFKSLVALASALPAQCRGYFCARRSDGSVAIFAGTSTRLYLMDNTDFTWDDVSDGGSAYSALPTSYHWQFAQFGNFVIAVQPNVVPQVFDLGTPATFEILAGSPPQAGYISIVGRFVVLSGLLSNPYRIQWSGLNDVTEWTSGSNSSDFQDLPDGGIVRGVAGGEFGVIFQETAMRRMIYVPGSPIIFQIERITEDKGLHAPYSLIRAGDRIFFLASQGFQMMAATGLPAPIGKERVDRTFFADYDSGSLQLVIGAADPQESRVYWTYRSSSGSGTLFDHIISYDYALERWGGIVELSGEYLSSLASPGLTLEGLDAVSASLDALSGSLDDISTAALSKVSAFDGSHQLGFFTGSNLEATIDTQEQALDNGRRVRVRGIRPITDAACYGSVVARETVQDAVTVSAEQQVNGRGLCPANVSTRMARARIRMPAEDVWTYALGVEPIFAPEGSR